MRPPLCPVRGRAPLWLLLAQLLCAGPTASAFVIVAGVTPCRGACVAILGWWRILPHGLPRSDLMRGAASAGITSLIGAGLAAVHAVEASVRAL
mmetsp:Transcript_66399/g.187076  ORF Transcript_66399/g.187076 Transcript_66399/m.187076 type:complete len:94 (+) Transcript_66399:327-608(+)